MAAIVLSLPQHFPVKVSTIFDSSAHTYLSRAPRSEFKFGYKTKNSNFRKYAEVTKSHQCETLQTIESFTGEPFPISTSSIEPLLSLVAVPGRNCFIAYCNHVTTPEML